MQGGSAYHAFGDDGVLDHAVLILAVGHHSVVEVASQELVSLVRDEKEGRQPCIP